MTNPISPERQPGEQLLTGAEAVAQYQATQEYLNDPNLSPDVRDKLAGRLQVLAEGLLYADAVAKVVAEETGAEFDPAEGVKEILEAHFSFEDKNDLDDERNWANTLPNTAEAQAFKTEAEQAHQQTVELMSATGNVFGEVPDISELDIDWNRLQQAKQAYEQLGIPTSIVFTPMTPELAPEQILETWKEFYSNLRAWQDDQVENHGLVVPAGARLQNRDDGDGLWIYDQVLPTWQEHHTNNPPDPNTPAWRVSILPTDQEPIITNVAHDMTDAQGHKPQILTDLDQALQNQTQDPNTLITNHPSLQTLMIAIANRIFDGQKPMDSSTWPWSIVSGVSAALTVNWSPGSGQAFLYCYVSGLRDGALGVRPEVRGAP